MTFRLFNIGAELNEHGKAWNGRFEISMEHGENTHLLRDNTFMPRPDRDMAIRLVRDYLRERFGFADWQMDLAEDPGTGFLNLPILAHD